MPSQFHFWLNSSGCAEHSTAYLLLDTWLVHEGIWEVTFNIVLFKSRVSGYLPMAWSYKNLESRRIHEYMLINFNFLGYFWISVNNVSNVEGWS